MKYCGKERGSITLFLALILSLLLSLVCTSIESVRMASARTQILNSMDIGLYSVFGQYDRKLLEEYDLFALDGSMGGGQLNLAKICDNLESYMKPVLKQNSQKLELHQSGLTGYRLLTDECGEVFYQQIVQYMQETLGSQGVQLLLNKMSDRERKTEEADLKAKQAETGGSIDRYDSEMNQASQKSRQAAQEAENRQQQEGQISTQPAPTQPQADNPISIIKRIMKMGILELVLPPGREISTRTVSKDTMVSGRQLQQGMEMPDGVTADSSYTSGVLFQQYLMNHLGNYTDPSKESLAYQMEYVFGGRDNDIDNLKSVASKLLFIREGVNFACLMADNVKRTEAQALARHRTDALDSLGNTTAATGKGFAIGSAALTGLALLASYIEEIRIGLERIGTTLLELPGGISITIREASFTDFMMYYDVTLMNPKVLSGMFIGSMMAFLFCGLTMNAVGRAAASMVEEVRRQFREIKGILEGKAEPDYARCVQISTQGAQREMVFPSLLAIIAPIVTGLLFGVPGVIGLLIGGLSSGFVLAIFMANAGGAWDNAKKYVEEGNFGGKGSEVHRAAVVGDTVGDPFKDTSGPSLNILIKLMSMVAIVMAGLTVSWSLF